MKNIHYALQGFLAALRSERNMRFHLVAAMLVVAAGIWLSISKVEWLIIILCIALVLSFELMNTAIEQLCNIVTIEKHSAIKIVKDIAAAAVLVVSVASAVIGLLIFAPKLLFLFNL